MIYKSFGIIRTNVGLTTNVKLMVKSDYKLYLDSIDSNDDLSLSRFKKFAVNKKDRYDRLIPNFFNKFPSDLAFDIKYDNDVDSMKDDFKHQYDEIYQYGARNIINNRSYSEEFEYFAPLYIFPDNLPNSFIIFRVDEPGLDIYNKDNFSELIVKNFKTVKRFDLTKKSPLGEWLDINYTRNDTFPISPLDIDFKINEFSKWYGIDYKTGGYVNKSIFLEEWFGEEKEIFEMEKFIFDGYKDKKVVFPNILNLSFLFDDTPSTPDRKRKWSLNRYYGFYFDDMEHVTSVFPTKTKQVKENISITTDNIITHSDGYPFVEEWDDSITNYIEIEGVFYRIERIENIKEPEVPSEIVDDLEDDVVIIDLNNKTETTSINSAFVEEFLDYIVYTYKIISTKTLSKFTNGYINKNTSISINSDNEIKTLDGDYDVDLFDNADVWLIEINGVFHNIVRTSTDSLKLITDYSFLFDDESSNYSYKVGGDQTIVSILKEEGVDPEEFKIYKLRFSDLKDFDTRIIDTEPSKFEYELNDKLTETDESKMYVTDLNSETNPKEVDGFVIDEKLVNIPVSSEYTANYETFKITENGLTELWRKNSVYCRWGFQKSISGNDYPYLLDNSLLFEDFNRTSNPFNPDPKRIERNLDYFYTINSDSSDYIHHSLHLEDYNDDFTLKEDYFFDLRKYLDKDGYDYYSNFFNKRSNFFNGEISRNTIKHSYFNKGDESIPNVTLFRGIKFLIYDVEDIRKNENNELDVINLKTSNEFQDYKFSILLSDNKLIEKQTISASFSIQSCEIAATHSLQFSDTNVSSYRDLSEERRLYHDGSPQNDLVGRYIIENNNMPPTTSSVCQITTSIFSSFTQSGMTVSTGNKKDSYGKRGAYFYPDVTNITDLPLTRISGGGPELTTQDGTHISATDISDSTNTFWGTGASSPLDGRLNEVGIWASETEWLGFSECVEITETKTYYIGISGDNYIRFSIDGDMILDIAPTSSGGDNSNGYNHEIWHVIPYTLSKGKHIIELSGRNESSLVAFGAEIYNPTDLTTLINSTTIADTNKIFSTIDQISTESNPKYYDLGETIGYTCPDGYSLDTCNSGNFLCTKIDSFTCLGTETKVTECGNTVVYKILEAGEDSSNNFPYLVLGNIDGTPINPFVYELPESLGNFSTVDSIDEYPYIELDFNTGVTLGDEIKITDDFTNTTYDGFVFETGFLDGDIENYYIKTRDISGDGSVIPPGDDINIEIGAGRSGNISYEGCFSENMMKWINIENWQMDKKYPINSYVSYDDIIYRSLTDIEPSKPTVEVEVDGNIYTIKSAPYNIDGWEKFDYDKDHSPFYNFIDVYGIDDIVYSSGNYYKCVYIYNITGGYDFWDPYYNINGRGYSKNQVVLHKGLYYKSLINNNVYSPSENYTGSWLEIIPDIDDTIKWDKVLIWNPSKNYIVGDVIVHNEVVYSVINNVETGEEPGISNNWERKTSLIPNSDFKYNYNDNPFIRFNNNYYLITSNNTESTLENGIKIYINKKWKNILVNIEIKDNTTPNLKNVNRDELYVELNKKLTANNFINCINDFSNKYDFIDYLKYIIIDEEGDITEYDYNDIEGLPYLINCEFPDELEVKIDSLTTENIDLKNDLIAKKVLKDGLLDNNEQINYYNGVPLAVKITENKNEPKTFSNFGGNKNLTNNLLYRFSGFYMPIFYDVHMFFKGLEKISDEYDFSTSCVPPVSFSGVDTPNLPWHNHIPDGEFSGRTWLYDNKFDDIRYNIKFSYPEKIHYPSDGGDPIVIDKVDVTPIKAGWDAVLVNYVEHASEYYNYFPKDNKRFVIADFDSYPWVENSYLDHFHLGLCWSKWTNSGDTYAGFFQKFYQEINNNRYRYKTPYDITPYVGWYILASDSAKNMAKLTQVYRDSTGIDDFGYYDNLRTFYTNCSDSINTPIIVMYKIETARFNEDSGFFEFTVVYPDGTINNSAIVNSIEDLVLVKNLHDNFGIFVESNTLELEVGDIVKITETDCDLSNNPEPYYIKSISEYEIGFLLDIYDDNDERVCLEDGRNGKVQLSKSRYTDNYKFNTELTEFGNMLEKKVSKINRKGSVLKLKDKSDIRSIYPMLDEFGYTFTDFFVFKGTFDFNYHLETYGSESEVEGLLDVNDLIKSFNLGKK